MKYSACLLLALEPLGVISVVKRKDGLYTEDLAFSYGKPASYSGKISQKTVYCGGVKSTCHYTYDRLGRLTDAAFERVTKPQRLLLGGGYLTLSDNIYHHYITDYQGNVVLVINTCDRSIEQQTGYYPYGMPHGDAVGADAQPNKYSGKRLQTFAGMDTYDFHARQLPIGIPRFDRPDPMAEKYRHLGLYTYCAGDPINATDPTGCKVMATDKQNIKESKIQTCAILLIINLFKFRKLTKVTDGFKYGRAFGTSVLKSVLLGSATVRDAETCRRHVRTFNFQDMNSDLRKIN